MGNTSRPKVGVVLGSGAARGWSHLGVLQVLQEHSIPIEFISGCSIGAFIGAIYARGALDKFTDWVLKLGKREMASLLDPSLSGGGLLKGSKLMDFFERFSLHCDFADLGLPFASVCTNLHTGREVWHKSGPVMPAIRASISLPGLLQPFFHQEQWLVDGGLVNPVPVSLARALGADFVIAVNLNHELIAASADMSSEPNSFLFSSLGRISKKILGDDETPSYYDVLNKSIKIMQDRITRARAAGDPPEIMLEPLLGKMSIYDFDQPLFAIEKGRECAEKSIDKIQRYLSLA